MKSVIVLQPKTAAKLSKPIKHVKVIIKPAEAPEKPNIDDTESVTIVYPKTVTKLLN